MISIEQFQPGLFDIRRAVQIPPGGRPRGPRQPKNPPPIPKSIGVCPTGPKIRSIDTVCKQPEGPPPNFTLKCPKNPRPPFIFSGERSQPSAFFLN